MTNEILTTAELDSCAEIYGIGMGSAANTISQVIDKPVSISKVGCSQAKVSEVDVSAFGGGLYAGVKFAGGISGGSCMLFRSEEISAVLNILMGTTELDDMGVSTVQEIFNMMMQTCVSSINEFLKNTSILSLSASPFDGADIASELGVSADTNVMAIEFNMEITGVTSGKFVYLSTPALTQSMVTVLESIGMLASGGSAPAASTAQQQPAPQPTQAVQPTEYQTAAPTENTAALDYSQQQYDYAAYYAQYYAAQEPEVKISKPEFPDFGSDYSFVPNVYVAENMENLMKVDLRVSAELGKVRWKLKDIVALKKDDILQLEKAAGAPVELVANKQTVGYGDVLVIGDNFYPHY